MKRHGNLWEKITDIDNLRHAHNQARRGKAHYREVKMVDSDPDRYLTEIQKAMVEKTFTTSPYEVEDRFDGRKMRTIYKLPYYPDRIVQHALLSVVGDILTRTFIRDTFQSIQGRGTTDAMRRVKRLVRSKACPPFALKIDVYKYYPSVNNDKLKAMLRRKIKCPDTLWLVEDIIDSMPGLPIGNYTSQHFGNLYLNQFDWTIKQQLKPAGYFRYCDDIVFFGHSRRELMAIKAQVETMLADLDLSIKPDWRVYDVQKDGIDFVGYVFRPANTRVRRNIANSFRKTCRRLSSGRQLANPLNSLMAYKGWFTHCNAKRLWRRHTKPILHQHPKHLRAAL